MAITQEHQVKKWEISLIELQDGSEKKFKVTRRLPGLSVAETKVFISKEEAKKQFEEWLD
jgi:hypothetical protein